MSDDGRTFQQFMEQVKGLCEGKAKEKKYNTTGIDGPNQLYDFVYELTGGPHHALGEIIYKVQRYAAKGNEEDILKVAAWAFLCWRRGR